MLSFLFLFWELNSRCKREGRERVGERHLIAPINGKIGEERVVVMMMMVV